MRRIFGWNKEEKKEVEPTPTLAEGIAMVPWLSACEFPSSFLFSLLVQLLVSYFQIDSRASLLDEKIKKIDQEIVKY